jgi:hypothetical protein
MRFLAQKPPRGSDFFENYPTKINGKISKGTGNFLAGTAILPTHNRNRRRIRFSMRTGCLPSHSVCIDTVAAWCSGRCPQSHLGTRFHHYYRERRYLPLTPAETARSGTERNS